ncbi:MAG: DUF169 domain-containing protein [Megasphaera sp.]|jgi:uncharacterized protein (DUF169 family)|uniref:DUF169 domain-containing protein n=1 Tax=Megasphaera sueciensis TaxID=349094 RepID=UPI003CFCEBA4|nr:DUF169 domain-containing protein [Megasphaera sp.]MCI1824077.1 DUF169 domain-containing protein [Megasphaera sp.]
MKSKLIEALALRYEPVAVLLSNKKPEYALQSKEGIKNCIISLFIAAMKGKSSVFERKTNLCSDAIAGLGFGTFPNHPEGVAYFLTTEKTRQFERGGCIKTPELGKNFVECLPITDISYQYVIFKPLSQVNTDEERPVLCIFGVNNDQLSALIVMANYYGSGNENVIIPQSSGCQSIFLIPYAESQKKNPRAVVGLTDITVRPMLDSDIVSFAVPYAMFVEMEQHVTGSFLEKRLWQRIKNK